VFAITRSGPDRFRTVPQAQLEADSARLAQSLNQIGNGGSVTIPAGNSSHHQSGICWRNDIIDARDSQVEVVIANGPGYTINPERGRLAFTITEDDSCTNPASTPGGVVWKESGCRCATQSTHASVRRLSRKTTVLNAGEDNERTVMQPEGAYHQTLRNLAGSVFRSVLSLLPGITLEGTALTAC